MKTISSTHIINPLRRTFAWTSLLLATVQGTYGMLEPEDLEAAFRGERPLYAISVTRSTKYNLKNEYKSLQDSQIYLIVSVLKAVLGQPLSQEKFEEKLDFILTKELEKYNKLSDQITKKIPSIQEEAEQDAIQKLYKKYKKTIDNNKKELKISTNLDNFQYLKTILDGKTTESIDNSILNKSSLDKEYQQIISQFKKDIVMNQLPKLTQHFKDYWDGNKLNKEEILRKYILNYQAFVKQLNTQDYIKPLKKGINLVAFNEMFFGKNVSFQKDEMEELFKDFSKDFLNSIFFVNFLVNSSKTFDTSNNKNKFIDQCLISQDLFDDTQDKGYETYIKQLNTLKSDPSLIINLLENISFTYHAGLPLTYYNKSTYFQENDDDLNQGCVYVFGDKQDHTFDFSLNQDISKDISDLQQTLLDHISTEICYDLTLGIRKNKGHKDTYTMHSTLHLVPSNTLRFSDKILQNLPEKAKIVWHVDPEKQEVLVKEPLIQIDFEDEKIQKKEKIVEPKYKSLYNWKESGFPVMKINFKLTEEDNNIYTITITNLTPILSILNESKNGDTDETHI